MLDTGTLAAVELLRLGAAQPEPEPEPEPAQPEPERQPQPAGGQGRRAAPMVTGPLCQPSEECLADSQPLAGEPSD